MSVPDTPRPQRAWRAACPGCGAPVDFASAASASAVCSFCRSTLLREGDALRRIGVSAELFDDHSPLQLGATGRHQGVPFSVVGRLQYRYADGTWNEWHVLFEASGEGSAPKSAWLSEDNGAHVLSFDQPPLADAPAAHELHAGERRLVGGSAWSVASVVQAALIAALGELPRPPRLASAGPLPSGQPTLSEGGVGTPTPGAPGFQGEFAVADLRNERGEVGTLDYADPATPQWSVGRAVTLAELAMQGLKEGVAEQTLAGRTLRLPQLAAHTLSPKVDQQPVHRLQPMSCGGGPVGREVAG